MATSILYRISVLALVALLGACGGGGDAQVAADVDPNAPCSLAAQQAGRQVDRILVPDDHYTVTEAGVGQRTFGPIVYTNSTQSTVRLQVSLAAARTIETPAGMVGTTDVLLGMSVVDETLNQLVQTSGDGCRPAVDDMPAGETANLTEQHRFNIDVLPGHRITISSIASVAKNVGSIGDILINTTNLDFSVSEI
jgi:hypothetical protein